MKKTIETAVLYLEQFRQANPNIHPHVLGHISEAINQLLQAENDYHGWKIMGKPAVFPPMEQK